MARRLDATHHFLTRTDRQDIEAEVIDLLPQAPLWLAVDDGDVPLGFMLLEADHPKAPFIDPLQRGLGVSRALVRHALTLYPTMTTDANEQYIRAMGFYVHIGFERIGRSSTDNRGRAYPLIHMRLSRKSDPLS